MNCNNHWYTSKEDLAKYGDCPIHNKREGINMKLQSEYHRQLLLRAIAKLKEGYPEECLKLIERVLYEE